MIFKKHKTEPKEQEIRRKERWFYADTYWIDREEKERTKSDVDYKHFKKGRKTITNPLLL